MNNTMKNLGILTLLAGSLLTPSFNATANADAPYPCYEKPKAAAPTRTHTKKYTHPVKKHVAKHVATPTKPANVTATATASVAPITINVYVPAPQPKIVAETAKPECKTCDPIGYVPLSGAFSAHAINFYNSNSDESQDIDHAQENNTFKLRLIPSQSL
jgi:hypothetical protein